MASKQGKTIFKRPGKPAEEIRYAVGQFSLGLILAAFSAKGLVAVKIGEDSVHMVKELQNLFPTAQIVPGNRDDEKRLKRVIDFVEEPAHGLDFPLDMRGTAFQQRVWQAVRKIPPGQTSTYTEIARKIGAPKAMRAVGTACSICILAFVVPCHRVLHNDGSLARGNRGENERQRALLDREFDGG